MAENFKGQGGPMTEQNQDMENQRPSRQEDRSGSTSTQQGQGSRSNMGNQSDQEQGRSGNDSSRSNTGNRGSEQERSGQESGNQGRSGSQGSNIDQDVNLEDDSRSDRGR